MNPGRNDSQGVFISYARTDIKVVDDYVRALVRKGVPVWVDQASIQPSDSIVWAISQGIEQSGCAIIFHSRAYAESVWTREELAALVFSAIVARDRRVFVVRLDDTDLPRVLAHRRWLQGTPDSVAASVHGLLNSADGDRSSCTGGRFAERPVDLTQLEDRELHQLAASLCRRDARVQVGAMTLQRDGRRVSPELIADLDNCLELNRIHSAYIRDIRAQIASGGLGIFVTGFRLELERRLEERDEVRDETRTYVDEVIASGYAGATPR